MTAGARLALGCASIGNLYAALSDADAHATVDAAWDHGIRFFDTAPHYGAGLSERRLGAALRDRPRREFQISTKVGRLLVEGADANSIFEDVPAFHSEFDFSGDGVRRSLESSLERLGVDFVDVVHVHDPDDHADLALDEAFPALCALRDEGVIGRVSAGMNQSALLTRFVREADVDCVLLAGRYTLLDQSAADDLLPICLDRGVPVIAAGVFNSGLLAAPKPGAYFDYAPAPAGVLDRAEAMARTCRAFGVPLTAAAMQFPGRHPAVDTVLVGMRTADEVRANVADFALTVPEELWSDLGVADQAHSK
jgi:D-threo-aldose 1-dehydrogenase